VGEQATSDWYASAAVSGAVHAAAGAVAFGVLAPLTLLGLDTWDAHVEHTVAAPSWDAGTVLGLLYVLPIVAGTLSDPGWRRHLEQIGPMSAGLAVQATRGLSELPIGPWAGLGVLGMWSAAALACGGARLKHRDA
jgi:ABC-2 type transport system permease protein